MKQQRHQIVEIIGKRTLNIHDPKDLANEIAAYLLSENLVSELDSIMRDVVDYRASHGIVEATVVIAHELDDNIRREVKNLLKQEYPNAKTVLANERIDTQAVGGVRVVLPHEQLDLTLRSKLSNFKRLTMLGKE